jgi:hypothetical protein
MKWALAWPLALIACACTAPQKPFFSLDDRDHPFVPKRECSDEPSGWHELTALKVDGTFAVRIAGWEFCYVLPMHPGVARVELVAGTRTLFAVSRASVEPRVVVDPGEPRIAIAYQNDGADYALAQMHVEAEDVECLRARIAESSGTGFRGLGTRCWSYWNRHFERDYPPRIDPGMNHYESFYTTRPRRGLSRGGAPAVLIVSDVFHRWTFSLPFLAACTVGPVPRGPV